MIKRCFTALVIAFFPTGLFCSDFDQELENAYRSLFSKEFGYTLIGEKPISFEENAINEYLFYHPEVVAKFTYSLDKTFKNSHTVILKTFLEPDYYIEIIHKPAVAQLLRKDQRLQNFIKLNFQSNSDFFKKLEDPKT